ncbi:hypothetical protein [Methylopila sp. M107]|uniref:hypothetical protein n=1 Tax=Methylopila sp. M107 TaxID=1101190 RepID=UPI00039EB690|nr:hypothetical protein [Methylopila sp. M107]
MTTGHTHIGHPMTDTDTTPVAALDGPAAWRVWLSPQRSILTTPELSAAMSHAAAERLCDGDPRDPVATTGDRDHDRRRLRARTLYRELVQRRPVDRDEALTIARAVAAVPPDWRSALPSRSLDVRDALYAVDPDAAAQAPRRGLPL